MWAAPTPMHHHVTEPLVSYHLHTTLMYCKLLYYAMVLTFLYYFEASRAINGGSEFVVAEYGKVAYDFGGESFQSILVDIIHDFGDDLI